MASVSANMSRNQDALSLQVSLPQMLDLALGTPELGAVNFKLLHNFLHVLLYQTNLRSTRVEFRGNEANRMKDVIRTSKARSSLELHEYNIIDGLGNLSKRIRKSGQGMEVDVITDGEYSEKSGQPAASAPSTSRGTFRKDDSIASLDSAGGSSAARKTAGVKQQISFGVDGDRQSIIFVEPIMDGVTPTALGFKRLEDTVKDLQQKFQALDEIANNPEMIERIRSNKSEPLSDMWHGINVSKRLDASEQGIEKLTTMLQDLIKGDSIKSNDNKSENMKSQNIEIDGKKTEEFGVLVERVTELENNVAYLGGDVAELKKAEGHRDEEIREIKSKTDQQKISVKDDSSKSDNAATKSKVFEDKSQEERKKSPPMSIRHSVVGGVDLTELKDDVKELRNDITTVQKEVQDLNSKLDNVVSASKLVLGEIDVSKSKTDDMSKSMSAVGVIKETVFDETSVASKKEASKMSVTENSEMAEKKSTPSSSHVILEQSNKGSSLRELNSRVTEVENEIACITQKLNSEEGNSKISDLVKKIQEMEADMEKINETASRLMEDKENRDTHRDALIEQIELLKTIKADREDLEDALADKADAQTVNRKVSHDQFDAACDDLARGLEDAISKLSQQETIWQQALDEVQKEIEGKLDKVEISPLKDFVNNRLKLLQEKLKALAEMRRDNEAAGTKRMLRDVQCISCDANAVMRMDEGIQYKAPAMHSTKSIKPYLTYELDQVRKQQRKLPHSRNMIQFEAAMREMTRKAKPLKDDTLEKFPRDHLCNRYCGGSHTITTPQQRVMRMGHFLSQWGPEVVQLSEGVVLGNDGQLYRSREMPPHTPRKPDVCGPCGDGESSSSRSSTPPAPEPAPVTQRQSQLNQKRSSISQVSKRPSARKPSERIKDTVEQKIEEIPAEPSTPPNAPPGTIVDDSDAVPKPSGPADEVVHVERSESANPDPAEIEGEGNIVQ